MPRPAVTGEPTDGAGDTTPAREWDPWAVTALVTGLIMPPFAIAPATVAFISLRRDPTRRGRIFAVFGLVSFTAFVIYMGFVLGLAPGID